MMAAVWLPSASLGSAAAQAPHDHARTIDRVRFRSIPAFTSGEARPTPGSAPSPMPDATAPRIRRQNNGFQPTP